ncbi:hypothetical protein LOTGIDRAFT_135141 [Lottia gigantea]|uniref:Fibrinogen C-terminal domain-containing protein n=1 Tax=Lottia gigantea TaxID=225164 RepID=V3ZDS2_LOTGI|nr:hypothetical protein LOTGIDRAFT_135141 [Lottia gigantea]ESO82192.1 hypothetical protein LOTGIDRAFT_135141 [Lottia gigantea]
MYLQINSYWSPNVSFDRTWQEYVDGFGYDVDWFGSHWLGLQSIFEITNSRSYDLQIKIHVSQQWKKKTIKYHDFKITDTASGFRLMIGTAEPMDSSPLEDCLSALNNTEFSTSDRPTSICSSAAQSGWWFGTVETNCSCCNANGNIDFYRTEQGAFWNDGFQTDTVVYTEMVLLAA